MTVGAGIAEDGEGGDGHPLRQPKWFVASTIAQAQLQLHPVDRRHGAIVGRGLRAVTRSGVGLPSPTDRIRSRREMNNLSSTLHCRRSPTSTDRPRSDRYRCSRTPRTVTNISSRTWKAVDRRIEHQPTTATVAPQAPVAEG